jgi:Sel1 repeat-containing protein
MAKVCSRITFWRPSRTEKQLSTFLIAEGAGQGRNNLGLLYMEGLGVPKDYVRAYMWFSLTNFELNLSYAKAQMTPAQVFEAERMAAEWKSDHPER